MGELKMINLEYFNNKFTTPHSHVDLELIYVIEGHADIIVEEQPIRLNNKDFILINSKQEHSYVVYEGGLIGCFHISYLQICKLLNYKNISFELNSTKHRENHDYEKMRKILDDIFSIGYNTRESFKFYSQYYRFMDMLTQKFLIVDEKGANINDDNKRMKKIEDYIKENYNKNANLSDLASRLYLSTTYLSKYIKRKFGKNFLDLVNDTRINHAIPQLIYTDESLTKIAMNVGFTNLRSFNQAFMDRYNITPSHFRKNFKQSTVIGNKLIDKTPLLENSLIDYQNDKETIVKNVKVPNKPKGELFKYWNQMINIGTAEELMQSDIQEHVIQLKNQLDFRYIRFWNLYTDTLYLDKHEIGKVYNFNRLDRILDFLVKNGLKPHIEIANKPKLISTKSREHDKIVHSSYTNLFSSQELVRYFFTQFMEHLVERYGTEEVKTWRFEFWMEEKEVDLYKNKCDEDDIKEYANNFNTIAEVFRNIVPDVQLGAGGFSIRYGKEFLECVISAMEKLAQKPDFLTFYAFPYPKIGDEHTIANISTDPDYLRNLLEYLHSVVKKTSLKDKELHVTEWNLTPNNCNVMNDSCFKGAYIVKNIIDCVGLTDCLGYWVGTDLYGDFVDDRFFINGSCGLLTESGIKKPAWYAFSFMNSLGKYLYGKGKNYIVTRDSNSNWYILCHNCKALNHNYYLNPEENLKISDIDSLFVDSKHLNLHFEIEVGDEERFRVKIISVNKEHGSIQEEWIRMNKPDHLDSDDIDYLKDICKPSVKIKTMTAHKEKIYINTELEPNEFQLIQIINIKNCPR